MRLFGLALLAGAGLMLEIGLTRLFSTLYYPPYVFVVLSLAVLGVGAGAGLVAWRPGWAQARLLPWYASAAALTALLLLITLLQWPGLARGAVELGLMVLPFLAMGMTVAALFSLDAARSPWLYRADLVGAGVGAAAALPLLDALGVINGVLASVLLLAMAALLLAGTMRTPVTAVAAGILVLLLVNVARPVLYLDWSRAPTDKPILNSLAVPGRALASTWDAFVRTDLVDPGDGRPYELYMDGGAGSVMPPAAGDPALWRDIGLFPFATEQPERVFIIGPGGGADVWFAVQGRAQEIVAVEVNRASVDLVRAYGDYNGELYDRPEVRVVVDEGRHVLEREDATYDLIFLSHVLTLASERTGFSLVENRALTVEAFTSYMAHLRPGGQLAVKLYDELTLTRALATALTVLRAQGMDDAQALQHVMVLLDGAADPAVPLLLVRTTPFTRDDSLSLGAVAREVGFTPLFLPQVLANPPLDQVVNGVRTFAQVLADGESNLQPTTDDHPFFYQFERGLPQELRVLLGVLSAAIVGAMGLVMLVQRRMDAAARLPWAPLYFAALGMGFMMVEIAVIQQTQRLLGHPAQAVTLVLAALLVMGGVGSAALGARVPAPRAWLPAAVAASVLAWLVLWPRVADAFMGAPDPWRVAMTLAVLALPAFFMGAPFPIGLRHVGAVDRRHVALAWSVNGIMSVAGSGVGVAIAVLFGFQATLITAAGIYLIAALTARTLGPIRGHG